MVGRPVGSMTGGPLAMGGIQFPSPFAEHGLASTCSAETGPAGQQSAGDPPIARSFLSQAQAVTIYGTIIMTPANLG